MSDATPPTDDPGEFETVAHPATDGLETDTVILAEDPLTEPAQDTAATPSDQRVSASADVAAVNASQPRAIVISPQTLCGLVAAAVVVFGSFGDWAVVGPIGVSGVRGDGLFTVALGLLGLVGVGFPRLRLMALGAGVAAAGLAIYEIARLLSLDSELWSVSVGWGLILVVVGSVALMGSVLYSLGQAPDKRPAAASGALSAVALTVVLALALIGAFNDGTDPSNPDQRATVSDEPDTTSSQETPSAETDTTSTLEQAEIGGQIRLTGDAGLKMVATVERVIDPVTGGEFDEPTTGKRYVGVMLRLTNVGDSGYDDAPSNGAALTYGDDRQASASVVSQGECSGNFASSARISAGSRRKGCIVFEVPQQNTIKTFQFSLDSGFADEAGEWNVRPADRSGTPRTSTPSPRTPVSPSPGPLHACDQNISAGANTTCQFANDVFKDYAAQIQADGGSDKTVGAYSDSAGRTILVDCVSDGTQVTCSGGTNAKVTFPKWAADVY